MFAASKTSSPVNGVTSDPQFNYVTMLLHGDGTNGAQNNTFLDSSTNNYSITRTGNATQGSYSPYGANWSNYFDGTDDTLNLPASAALLGSGSYTVEFWVNLPNAPSGGAYFTCFAYGSSGAVLRCFLLNDAVTKLGIWIGASNIVYVNTSAMIGSWAHIALVRSGTTFTAYVNGVSVATTTDSTNFNTGQLYIASQASTNFLTGYISNFRIVVGTAVYLSNFTPPITPLTPIAGTALFTCQSQAFIDNSINAYAITSTGNTSVQRFSPFSPVTQTPISYSTYFDGNGDNLSIASSTAFGFGTGDFTIEFWAYSTSTARQDWVDIYDGSVRALLYYSGSNVTFYSVPPNASAITGGALVLNQWNHYAVSKVSGNTRLFVNGIQAGSTYTSNQNYGSNCFVSIGKDFAGSTYMTGYMSNVRIVKGTGLYTSNFTPSTTPLTAISGTSLLTCQSPTIIDNSTNAFPITVNGNTIARSQNPFGVTTTGTNLTTGLPYTTATFGGSGYLRGGVDWLTSATTVSATADFTLECWFNLALPQQNYRMISGSTIDGLARYLAINSTGIEMQFGTASSTIMSFNYTFKVGVWYHIAITRVGSTIRAFINGVSQSLYQGTQANSFSVKYIGVAYLETYAFPGYISDFRFVVGTALYTSGFVPPAAPLTAVTNTALLCNMTNAGIYDNAMMSDLETAGNAQISTSVVKYGTGSLAFDGTGDYLKTPYSVNWMLSGNFTIECWLYWTAHGSYGGVVGCANSNTSTGITAGWYLDFNSSTNNLQFEGQGGVSVVTTNAIPSSQWVHIAVVRSGSTITHYLNGVANGSGTSSTSFDSVNNPLYVGVDRGGSSTITGYIDDLRITKGYARYTANFTPPTAAFPNTGPI